MPTKPISYNLIDEAWIPVVKLDDSKVEMSLKEIFHQGHNIREIIDPSPEFEYGIYRFLVALVMEIQKFADDDEILDEIDKGKFSTKYLQYLDQYHSKFDLFDKSRPFYQGQVTEKLLKKKKSVINLLHQYPSGSNVIFFTHQFENEHALSAKVCAKALCAIPPFTTMGGRGYSPSVNGAPPIFVLLKGKNLFETVLYNVVPLNAEDIKESQVPWQRSSTVKFHGKRDVESELDGMTWMSRYVHLFPNGEGTCTYSGESSKILVKEIIYEGGFKVSNEWEDPNAAYRKSKKKSTIIRIREDKPLWRDYGPLLLYKKGIYTSKNGKVHFYSPRIMARFTEWLEDQFLPEPNPIYSINCYGLRTDLKAKIFEWQKETLTVPSKLLIHEGAIALLKDAMDMADQIAYYVGRDLNLVGNPSKDSKKDVFQTIQKQAKWSFWQGLYPDFTKQLIPLITENLDQPNLDEIITKNWAKCLKAVAQATFDQYSNIFTDSGRNVLNSGKALYQFQKDVGIALHRYQGTLTSSSSN